MTPFYYRDKSGNEIGPLDLATLAKFREAGALDGDSLVRAADSSEWKPCREIIADPEAATPVIPKPAYQQSGASHFGWLGWMMVALAITVICIALPKFERARAVAIRNRVMNDLRQIEFSKFQWAFENKKGLLAIPTENDLLPYLASKGFPKHPSGGNYVINAVKDPVESTQYGNYLNLATNGVLEKLNADDYDRGRMESLERIRELFGD